MGPRRVKGVEEDVKNAMLFVTSAKVCRVIENFMVVIVQVKRMIKRRAS
jgi:hypothetical protein